MTLPVDDWAEKSFLVTGGTGSFGRALVGALLREHRPRSIVVYSRDEWKQHRMQSAGLTHPSLEYVIGDVRDGERLRRACRGIDFAIHAAALKHVPVCELNPWEGVLTNIIGARNVIDAALDCGIERVVALSTDKAVHPVNLYGATKLVAEKLFIEANVHRGRGARTRLSCVRYGNVAGSSGSVLGLFREQRASGRVTVTVDRLTRFWMTVDEAVRFVLDCARRMEGGEVFVPKCPSMRIIDAARAVAPGARVEVVGIRPGEKIHEVLIGEDEARHAVEIDDRYVIVPEHPWWRGESLAGAAQLPDGFRYGSNENAEWVDAERIRAWAG